MDAVDEQPAVLNSPKIRYPCGSRTANRVVFYWNPSRRRSLYVHDLEKDISQKLTDCGLRTRSFAEDFLWGHDGERLFYIRTRGRGDFDGLFDLQEKDIKTAAPATTVFSDTSVFVLEDMHPERDELLVSYRRGHSQLYRLTLSTNQFQTDPWGVEASRSPSRIDMAFQKYQADVEAKWFGGCSCVFG